MSSSNRFSYSSSPQCCPPLVLFNLPPSIQLSSLFPLDFFHQHATTKQNTSHPSSTAPPIPPLIQSCPLPRGDAHISTTTRSRSCAHSRLHLQSLQHRLPPNHPDHRHPHLSLTWRLVSQLIRRLTHQYHPIRPRHNPASTHPPPSPTLTLSPTYRRLFLTTCTSIPGWPHQTSDMT
jgi:hypothetical protein